MTRSKRISAGDIRLARIAAWERAATRLGRAALKYAGIAVITWRLADAVKEVARAWAGQSTTADIRLNLSARAEMEAVASTLESWCWDVGWLALLVMAAGIGYGVRQRRLRRHAIERQSARLIELEQVRHPARSSSGLTRTGETNPEDV